MKIQRLGIMCKNCSVWPRIAVHKDMLTYCLPDPPKTSVYSYHIAHNLVGHLPSSHDGNRTAVCIPDSELVPWQSRSTGYSALFQNHRIFTVPCRWVATRSIVVAYNRCPLCFSYMVHNTVCERFVVWWTRRTTCNFSNSHRRSFFVFPPMVVETRTAP